MVAVQSTIAFKSDENLKEFKIAKRPGKGIKRNTIGYVHKVRGMHVYKSARDHTCFSPLTFLKPQLIVNQSTPSHSYS